MSKSVTNKETSKEENRGERRTGTTTVTSSVIMMILYKFVYYIKKSDVEDMEEIIKSSFVAGELGFCMKMCK